MISQRNVISWVICGPRHVSIYSWTNDLLQMSKKVTHNREKQNLQLMVMVKLTLTRRRIMIDPYPLSLQKLTLSGSRPQHKTLKTGN